MAVPDNMDIDLEDEDLDDQAWAWEPKEPKEPNPDLIPRSEYEELLKEKEKWRTRAKIGKKKAKELLSKQSSEPDNSSDPSDDLDDEPSFKDEDKWAEFQEFKEEVKFKEQNPWVTAEEIKEAKRIKAEEGLKSLDSAWKIHQYNKMSDPAAKAQMDLDRTVPHGKFVKSSSPEESEYKMARAVLFNKLWIKPQD